MAYVKAYHSPTTFEGQLFSPVLGETPLCRPSLLDKSRLLSNGAGSEDRHLPKVSMEVEYEYGVEISIGTVLTPASPGSSHSNPILEVELGGWRRGRIWH